MGARFGFAVRVLVVLAAFSTVAFSQSTGAILGAVTDQSGAAVTGATITATNVATSLQRTTTTDAEGNYQIPALPTGTYKVEAKSSGLQTAVAKDLVVAVDSRAVQNFSLKVAQASEIITIEATAPMIESTTMTVGQTINQKVVQEIPLNGRHFVDLGLLIPGSVTPPQNGFLTAPLRGQGSFAFNTAGNREDTVNFMINGVNLNDMVQNQITFQPSINTVSEFKVDNSTYSAEYGRNSGAIVNIATRSGGNDFHGEGFEFIRNNALDARNFFNTKPTLQSPFKRNQFGGAFGGPIIKDKTFSFLSYEGLRQRQGITLNTQVLNAAQRQQVLTANNPTSVQLLSLIPTANDSTGTRFLGSTTAPVDIDQGTADISHNLGQNVRLHGYYVFQRDLRKEPTLQLNTLPNFGDTRESHRQIFTFNVTQTFSSHVVNETRLGFNRIHITFMPNQTQNPASFGISNGVTTNLALPQISIGGTQVNFGGPQNFPQGRGDTTAVASDTVNYLRGNHSFKFGGEYRRFYNNNFTSDPGTLTFLNVGDFALGRPNGFMISLGNNPSRITVGAIGLYATDSWKLFPQFTLELGLRWDWNQTPSEAKDRFVNFIPQTGSLVQVSEPYKQNNENFQPRVGFAWDLFGAGKTVLRAGYGFLTDQPITNLVTGLTGNPPLGDPRNFASSPSKPTTTYSTLLTDAAASGLAPIVVDPKFTNANIQSYNLNLQQQLASKWSMMIGYFGSQGRHLRTRVNLNQFINGVRPFPTIPLNASIAPGKALGNISDNMSIGNSRYDALWVTSDLRAWRGLQFNASYTWSKSIDYTSQNGQIIVIQDSFNPAGDRGLSDFDARNRFVINFIYALPFHGNRFFEGWQFGSIIQSQSGNPVNILANATGIAFNGVANTIRPDLLGPIQVVNQRRSDGTIQYIANSVCNPTITNPATVGFCTAGTTFAIPATGAGFHFGNLRRNVIIGPGFNNVDFSITKKTRITERVSTEFRVEAFDLLNHPNLGQPGGNGISGRTAQVNNPNFGVISNTRFPIGDSGSARQLQFAAKILF